MAILDLFSLLPGKEKLGLAALALLAIVLAVCAGVWAGYSRGFKAADNAGRAALFAERLDRAEEAVQRALQVARLEAEARARVEEADARNTELENKYLAAERDFAAKRAALTRRINEVSARARSDCRGLSAEWVREYNLALAGTDGGPLPENAGGPLPGDSAGRLPAALPRLSPGSSLTDPADILAHARDYGGQCRRYAGQVRGWQETYRAWRAQ